MERRRFSEEEANYWFKRNADPELVRAFWAGEQPSDWPPSLSFPTDLAGATKKYDHKRRIPRRRKNVMGGDDP